MAAAPVRLMRRVNKRASSVDERVKQRSDGTCGGARHVSSVSGCQTPQLDRLPVLGFPAGGILKKRGETGMVN